MRVPETLHGPSNSLPKIIFQNGIPANTLYSDSDVCLSVLRFLSGLLDRIQVSYAMHKNTFAVSKILERKGGRFYLILHHEDELSILCTGFALCCIWTRFLFSTLNLYPFKAQLFALCAATFNVHTSYILPTQYILCFYMFFRISSERKSVYSAVRTGSSSKTDYSVLTGWPVVRQRTQWVQKLPFRVHMCTYFMYHAMLPYIYCVQCIYISYCICIGCKNRLSQDHKINALITQCAL